MELARVVRPSWNEMLAMDWPMAAAVARQLPLLKDEAGSKMAEALTALIGGLTTRR